MSTEITISAETARCIVEDLEHYRDRYAEGQVSEAIAAAETELTQVQVDDVRIRARINWDVHFRGLSALRRNKDLHKAARR